MSKKAVSSPAIPTTLDLAIETPFELSKDTADAVAAYHNDAASVETAIQVLHAERGKLVSVAMTTPLQGTLDAARILEARRQQLETELGNMRCRRHALLPMLLPDYRQHLAAETAHYESVLAEVIKELHETGAIDGMPAVGNAAVPHIRERFMPPNTAAIRNRARSDIRVMAAAGRMNRAKAALEALESRTLAAPMLRKCSIEWQRNGDPIVAQLLASACPMEAHEAELSFGANFVREQVGLTNAFLTTATIRTLEEIATTTGANSGTLPTLAACPIQDLVRLLPPTEKRRELLSLISRVAASRGANRMTRPARRTVYGERRSGIRVDPSNPDNVRDSEYEFAIDE